MDARDEYRKLMERAWLARTLEMTETTLYIKREPYRCEFFVYPAKVEPINFGPILTKDILDSLFRRREATSGRSDSAVDGSTTADH